MKSSTDIQGSKRMNPTDFNNPVTIHHECDIRHFSKMSIHFGWFAMEFGTVIHVPLRVNWNNFGEFLAPSSSQNLILSNTLVHD